MTLEQILEILDSYKLRIPPTVFYDLKADIVNYEEQEPTPKKDLAVAESISMDVLNNAIDHVEDYVCNHVKDHAKAQGMCDALTMIEEYIKEQNIEKNN